MVDIIVDNQYIELEDKAQNIKYNIQINDIFDLSTVNASYTNTFTVQKTPKNTSIFRMLGMVGDTSVFPYQKIPARLQDNGFPIIKEGWLQVTETTDSYKISITDGIIDFFKDIDNKTLGIDLDLSEINHRKDLNTVLASFGNDYYKYILAEYNGKTIGKTSTGTPAINIDYLVPSAKLSYLWDKVFNKFGYTYSGSIFSNEDFSDMWLTYPKPPEAAETTDPIQIAELEKLNYQVFGNPQEVFESAEFWNYATVTDGQVVGNWNFIIPETRNYRIRVRPKGYLVASSFRGIDDIAYVLQVKRGSNIILASQTSSEEEVDSFIDDYFYEGELITFSFALPQDSGSVFSVQMNLENLKVNIYTIDFGVVDFNNALSDFSIKDFFKEIIWRYGLTPVLDTVTKHIAFYTIDERLDVSLAKDWSNKYVSRTKETYIKTSYAQSNILKHKYNDGEQNFNNGFLNIFNQNLDEKKDIATSKTYSFDNRVTRILNIIESYYYPIWQPEPKEETDEEGNTVIITEYKALSGRFYFMKHKMMNVEVNYVSDTLGGELYASVAPVVDAQNTVFAQLVPIYYNGYRRILNDFRMHTITLALTISDILSLNPIVPYYFYQESSFYILNKLTWENGKVCTGEFIRLKKQ